MYGLKQGSKHNYIKNQYSFNMYGAWTIKSWIEDKSNIYWIPISLLNEEV